MASKDFDEWLCDKIKFLQLDEDIFLDYLKGVLEEDVSAEEKEETISNILQGATEEPITDICKEMVNKWNETSGNKVEQSPSQTNNVASKAEEKLLDIIHKQQETLAMTKPTDRTEDDIKRRLLEQYSHVSDGEESDDDKKTCAKKSDESQSQLSMFENINAKTVVENQKQQRETQKKAAEEKKEKDKANREAEKLKKQERQDKEKKRTQKGERKR
ncbi:coiled-coil domain-containing protein 43-like [Rhopilema esculentum]|uniref:coiled-coil domain-containing protein 43-like n=1 Tax=Rhopilema esculentum TaxID=499914 RepID=UPI0031E44B72